MDRNIQKNGILNLIVMVVLGVANFAVARQAGTLAGQVAAVFMVLGGLVALVSWFQMRLEEREQLEKLEYDELARSPSGSALFTSTEADSFPARRSREQFERWFVPGFTVLLVAAIAFGGFHLWRWLDIQAPLASVSPSMLAPAMFGLSALVLFLFGKYSANLSRLERQRLLQPGANLLLLNAYLSAVVVLAVLLVVFGGFERFDVRAARALCALLGLVAAEFLMTLVLEMYRPRVKGRVERLLYDSRLIGLLAQPESLFTTAAQALDYQFGFKVSETWFYRFLERSLSWIILAQVAILLLSTCLVFIEPGEQGVLERVGKPVAGREVLGPGIHLKMPWPIDRVYREHTERIQSFHVGMVPDPDRKRDQTVVWTLSHYTGTYDFLVASRETATTNASVEGAQAVPVNFLSASIPVQYQITNLLFWVYGHKDPARLLETIATREVVRYFVNVDLFEVMSTARGKTAADLQNLIQQEANRRQIGVRIILVGLQDIHPPVKVAGAFEEVVGALQVREATIEKARGYEASIVPLARAEATRRIREAEAYKARRIASAAAQSGQFTNQMTAWRASPTVYTERAYLRTLAEAGAKARKYVLLTTNSQDVIQLNLEEKLRPDLSDITVAPPRR